MTRILVADDEAVLCLTLQEALEKAGLQVETAMNGVTALQKLRTRQFDVALIDVHMPKPDGIELLARMEDERIDTEVVLMSGQASHRESFRAGKFRVYDFLDKPFTPRKLLDLLSELTESRLSYRHLPHEELARFIDNSIKEHSGNSDFRIRNLVQKVGFSPSHIAKLLKQYLQTSFGRRLKHHRIERAKRLLVTSRLNIKEIAAACGFASQGRLSESSGERGLHAQ